MKSPETYVGYERAQNFVSPGGLNLAGPQLYHAPNDFKLNQWAFDGNWQDEGQIATSLAPSSAILFRFHARDLHLVLGPAKGGKPVRFRVTMDGKALGANHGVDTDANGHGTVTGYRLYPAHPSARKHPGQDLPHRVSNSGRPGLLLHLWLKYRSSSKEGIIMNTNQNEPVVNRDIVATKTPRPSRRSFLVTAAGAVGAVAFWSLYRNPTSAVQASGGTPGSVTVIEFSPAGKPTGKVTVPRVVKSEADWKKQLSPVSFDVTRHAGTERAYTGNTWNNHDHGLCRIAASAIRN